MTKPRKKLTRPCSVLTAGAVLVVLFLFFHLKQRQEALTSESHQALADTEKVRSRPALDTHSPSRKQPEVAAVAAVRRLDPNPRISHQAISEVITQAGAVQLHRIITLRFLDQLEYFSAQPAVQARVQQELEDTADKYYLLGKIAKLHDMDTLGAESLTEAERQRVEEIIDFLGYSTPLARTADAAFSKFGLLRDEHTIHTLRKWLDQAP